MNVLDVQQLTKVYGEHGHRQTVLDALSFNIASAEFVAVMGQSGSGKSTLLYTVSGMDEMTEGEVSLNGELFSQQTADQMAEMRLHQMGFVFQNNYLLTNLTIIDNICLPAFKAKRLDRRAVRAKAQQLMAQMGIAEIADKNIEQVSGGQLQRAAVCRALINTPAILFADEPTGALNSSSSKEVIACFNHLNQQGMTILIVTHDAKVAAATDRILYIKDGKIEDQLKLGKLTEEDDRQRREQRVLQWLVSKGF